jgi:hypothetical protein
MLSPGTHGVVKPAEVRYYQYKKCFKVAEDLAKRKEKSQSKKRGGIRMVWGLGVNLLLTIEYLWRLTSLLLLNSLLAVYCVNPQLMTSQNWQSFLENNFQNEYFLSALVSISWL